MVSQFVSTHEVNLLSQLNFPFPEGTHAIGRLDNFSEGLLLLTTNKKITKLLFQGPELHKRKYLVQVNGQISEKALRDLREGVRFVIKGGGWYTSKPCIVEISEPFPDERKGNKKIYHTSSWISIILTEGKYHQIRKMVKCAGHKCLRLIRTSIENIELGDMKPGDVLEIPESEFYKKLQLK